MSSTLEPACVTLHATLVTSMVGPTVAVLWEVAPAIAIPLLPTIPAVAVITTAACFFVSAALLVARNEK